MGLSSDILWHQTSEEGLEGILNDKCLYYSYSHEYISVTDNTALNFAVPVISLCDLPFSEIGSYISAIHKNKSLNKDRIGRYGDYTIGFSREWSTRNHFNPVWYCEKGSDALINIREQIKLVSKIESTSNKASLTSLNRAIQHSLFYLKNYEGKIENLRYASYRFYDEREFRKVADIDSLSKKGLPVILSDTQQQKELVKKIREADPKIDKTYLMSYEEFRQKHGGSLLKEPDLSVPFEWSDIKYLIVKDQEKKKQFFQKLMQKDLANIIVPIFTIEEVLNNIIGTFHNKNM